MAEDESCVDDLAAEYARLAQQNTRDLAALSARLGGAREALAAAAASASGAAPGDECAWCGVALSRRLQCARCKAASFCCKEHQVAAWPSHKPLCKALAAVAHRGGDTGTAPAEGTAPADPAAPAPRSPAPVSKQRAHDALDGPPPGAAEALEPAHAAPSAEDAGRPRSERAGAGSRPRADGASAPGDDTCAALAGARNVQNRVKMLRLLSKVSQERRAGV